MTNLNTLEKKIDVLVVKVEDLGTKMATKSDLDDLAIMTKNNFDLVFEKFDRIDERFEQVDARFEQVDARFEQMDRRFDRIENISIGGHERRIENIEDDMRLVKTKVGLK